MSARPSSKGRNEGRAAWGSPSQPLSKADINEQKRKQEADASFYKKLLEHKKGQQEGNDNIYFNRKNRTRRASDERKEPPGVATRGTQKARPQNPLFDTPVGNPSSVGQMDTSAPSVNEAALNRQGTEDVISITKTGNAVLDEVPQESVLKTGRAQFLSKRAETLGANKNKLNKTLEVSANNAIRKVDAADATRIRREYENAQDVQIPNADLKLLRKRIDKRKQTAQSSAPTSDDIGRLERNKRFFVNKYLKPQKPGNSAVIPIASDTVQKVQEPEEAERLRMAKEEELQRKAAEEERQRKAAEEELQRKAAEEERQRKAAEEETERLRKAEEEERQRKAEEEEERQRKAEEEEERQRKAAEEEAERQRKAEEEAEKLANVEENSQENLNHDTTIGPVPSPGTSDETSPDVPVKSDDTVLPSIDDDDVYVKNESNFLETPLATHRSNVSDLTDDETDSDNDSQYEREIAAAATAAVSAIIRQKEKTSSEPCFYLSFLDIDIAKRTVEKVGKAMIVPDIDKLLSYLKSIHKFCKENKISSGSKLYIGLTPVNTAKKILIEPFNSRGEHMKDYEQQYINQLIFLSDDDFLTSDGIFGHLELTQEKKDDIIIQNILDKIRDYITEDNGKKLLDEYGKFSSDKSSINMEDFIKVMQDLNILTKDEAESMWEKFKEDDGTFNYNDFIKVLILSRKHRNSPAEIDIEPEPEPEAEPADEPEADINKPPYAQIDYNNISFDTFSKVIDNSVKTRGVLDTREKSIYIYMKDIIENQKQQFIQIISKIPQNTLIPLASTGKYTHVYFNDLIKNIIEKGYVTTLYEIYYELKKENITDDIIHRLSNICNQAHIKYGDDGILRGGKFK